MLPADNGLKGGVGEPVFCVATTFEFDASFFEAELLPRFLGLCFDHTENERTFIIEREESLQPPTWAFSWTRPSSIRAPDNASVGSIADSSAGGHSACESDGLGMGTARSSHRGIGESDGQGYRRNRELFAALDFFDAPMSAPLE